MADILDQDRSEIKWPTEPPHVLALDITRYECFPEKMDGLSIFRLVEKCAPTYVSQAFVDRVNQHGLRGFHFIKLWPLPKGVSYREEARKERKKNELVKTKRGPVPVKGNSVVIRLGLAKKKPSSREKERRAQLMDELDGLLHDPTAKPDAPVVGSLEGDEFNQGECRLFLSCPDADDLVEKLRPWLKTLAWEGGWTY